MTYEQLGSSCDHEHVGASADDIIRSQEMHRKDQVATGDETHRPAYVDLRSRWRRPGSGMRRYRQAKKDFAELSEQ